MTPAPMTRARRCAVYAVAAVVVALLVASTFAQARGYAHRRFDPSHPPQDEETGLKEEYEKVTVVEDADVGTAAVDLLPPVATGIVESDSSDVPPPPPGPHHHHHHHHHHHGHHGHCPCPPPPPHNESADSDSSDVPPPPPCPPDHHHHRGHHGHHGHHPHPHPHPPHNESRSNSGDVPPPPPPPSSHGRRDRRERAGTTGGVDSAAQRKIARKLRKERDAAQTGVEPARDKTKHHAVRDGKSERRSRVAREVRMDAPQ